MEIREIGRDESSLHHRFWEVGKRAEDAYRPYDFHRSWPAAQASLRTPRPDAEQILIGAFEPGTGDRERRLVGAATLGLPVLDNVHLAAWDCHVDPAAQGRGVGRALTEHAMGLARDRGRRTMVAEVYAPLQEDGPHLAFARALGFTPAVTDEIKVVDLPATEELWDGLADAALRHSGGYEIVTWLDEVPEAWLEGYCRLNEAFNEEAPLGELELEAEVWDAGRVRGMEDRARAIGRRVLAAAAVSPDGRMVGISELVVSDHAPQHGFQSGTLVLPGHRGHRLGILMKIVNHRATRKVFPECRVLMTGNADVNAAMNRVNAELGYRAVERCVEVQREL